MTVSSLSESFACKACSFSESPALLDVVLEMVLSRLVGSRVEGAAVREVAEVAVVGRVVVVRVAEVEEVGRALGVVEDVSLPTGLLVEVAVRDAAVEGAAGFLSKVEPATLDLRSRVEVDFNGARVDGVAAIEVRLAAPKVLRLSSPELAIDRGFSSAELLTDARDR